ncbi:unnamed protein product [Fusarium fujikuroi]|uniref:Uncharacterized protein n=1 Tax=Fusarium fujikuroi TaxID=5127 RepID=A0A9Q9RY70_FUSFU|nr:uncharacterized protein FFFS_04035 [Fusarium fujikuroi]VTT75659.1 unnamed protein product [Fusarium fujikuroi]VTT77910.1 unnamed protein product [Fusarium fujikuroi]VZH98330.1 unnamed protein product [Fusarium fujikuroi]
MAEPLLNTGDTMWSLLENVSEKRVGVENFNSDARDVLQVRVNGGFTLSQRTTSGSKACGSLQSADLTLTPDFCMSY